MRYLLKTRVFWFSVCVFFFFFGCVCTTVQRKKAELIEKARVKKAYAKVRAEQGLPVPSSRHRREIQQVGSTKQRGAPLDELSGEEASDDGSDDGSEISSEGDDRPSAKGESTSEYDDDEEDQEEGEEDRRGEKGRDVQSEGEEEEEENAGRFATQSNPLASLLDQATDQLSKKDERQQWKRHLMKGEERGARKRAEKEAQEQAARLATQQRAEETTRRAAQKTPEEQRAQAHGQRARHAKLWKKPAGSTRGRQRNQPNLSARVNVYLDRIKKGGSQPPAGRR